MAANTSIQWTDKTWDPVRGCSIVSPGCVNCYAMKQAHRFDAPGKPYEGLTKQTKAGPQWTGDVRLIESSLIEPLSWRKPARVFVNSMSDLFHESVPFEFIDRVFAVMALANQHTYQVLTKRAERMFQYMTNRALSAGYWKRAVPEGYALEFEGIPLVPFPLPNVWLGVSVEDQQRADERLPMLRQTPAAVRFISAEPLLGPVDVRHRQAMNQAELDWVIVGGESGPGARPFDLAWARSLVEQCRAAGVACFVKQLGKLPLEEFHRRPEDPRSVEGWTRARRNTTDGADIWYRYLPLADTKGGDPSEWPEDLRVRQFPATVTVDGAHP